MTSAPFLKLFPGDYHAKTRHLTTTEHGAYLLLLMAAWGRKDCGLPDDDQFLARTVGLSTRKWKAIKTPIMEFWELDDGYFFNQRLVNDRRKVKKTSLKNSESGGKGAAVTNSKRLKLNGSASATADISERRKSGILELESIARKKDPPIGPPKGTRAKQLGDWVPSKEDRAKAIEFWLGKKRSDILLAEQIDAFTDHHLAKGSKMKDWSRAWGTWFRNAIQFQRQEKVSNGGMTDTIDKLFEEDHAENIS